jgi:hypothetical protein
MNYTDPPAPPFEPDPKKQYRVWFTANNNGKPERKKLTGFIRFCYDGVGWGVYIDQPGDTEAYLPPGKYDQIQEDYDPRNGRT